MPELTTRRITARLKIPGGYVFGDFTVSLTLPFNGSRVDDDAMAFAELKRQGYIVNTIISQRGPRAS